MIVLRIVGYVLLLSGLVALGSDIFRSLEAGGWQSMALGQFWFGLDRASLNGFQVVLERHVWDVLWDPVMLAVLQWPVWAVAGVPGLLLLAIARGRRQRRMFS